MNILLEGHTADELLALSPSELRTLVACDEPLVFKVGTADVLGRFKVASETLFVELGHVDGGGEGALPVLASLVERFARREGLAFVDWRVHAVRCANPNLKLRRVLERRGFVVRRVAGVGECYWKHVALDRSARKDAAT